MAAPKGNQFWKLRSSHGRDKLFTSPELLWEAATEYFNWVDSHPWYNVEQAKGNSKPIEKKDGTYEFPPNLAKIPTARPYTLTGFLIYINVNKGYWSEFKKSGHQDFSEVIDLIENVIYTQKFEGAAVGAFNATIIARDLGLRDKTELSGPDGKDLFSEKSDDELKSLLTQTLQKMQ